MELKHAERIAELFAKLESLERARHRFTSGARWRTLGEAIESIKAELGRLLD